MAETAVPSTTRCRQTTRTARHLASTSVPLAQERLGHSTITTTLDLYSHVTETMQGEAAAKLDTAFRSAINATDPTKSRVRVAIWVARVERQPLSA
jgi:hypothetical protein